MTAKEYQYWVNRLAQYDPRSGTQGSPRDKAYLEMVKAGVPVDDRVAINRDAINLFEERRQSTRAAERALDKLVVMNAEDLRDRWRCVYPHFVRTWKILDKSSHVKPVDPEAWEQEYECSWVDEAAPIDTRPGKVNWVNPVPVRKWTDLITHSGRLDDYINQMQYGRSPAMSAMRDLALYGNAFIKFNTEGEKQMEKIDWHKPLRAFKTPGHEVVDAKVYTYKSGKQRVIWIDDRVYPVDEQGHAVADVDYGAHWVHKGFKIVENVPEEKFFVGLARNSDGLYWLTDGGTVSDANIMNYWKRIMAGDPRPHWVVDTRKPAEPPAVNVHDPKDWTVVIGRGNSTTSYGMRTEAEARYIAKEKERAVERGDVKVVRVRETPAPTDTARYIQLWRTNEGAPWRINKTGDGRQEFTWAETKNRGVSSTRTAIKVRD